MRSFKRVKAVLFTGNLFFSLSLMGEEKLTTLPVTPAESLLPMLLGLVGILMLIFVLAVAVKKLTGLNFISNNIKFN